MTGFAGPEEAVDASRQGREEARARLADLTGREREVAAAVARGLGNPEIATELYLSVATVKAHVSRALTKTGLENRVQLALLVREADLDS